jgi:hypothetical protein
MKALHPDHLEDLERSGLTPDTIRAAGIYTVSPGEIGKKLGGAGNSVVSALAFPYPGCDGFERYRLFREEGRTGPKYLQPRESPNHLYIPAGTETAGDSPLLVAEGEKKCLALRQAGFQVVGLGGIWAWCQKGEGYKKRKESRPIPDLDLVTWRRPVHVIFDSDAHDNPLVRLAAFRLSRELSRRGAAASILFIPPSPNREKQGADDYLVAHGPAKLREMMP